MPELPEVEVLVRHLAPVLKRKTIREVRVLRAKMVQPDTPQVFARAVIGGRFADVTRRGKYLVFTLRKPTRKRPLQIVGHLGMTGRMYLQSARAPLPRHAAVVLGLGRQNFVFEDTRYFGRLTLDTSAVAHLGPEPLSADFALEPFAQALQRSAQPIKVKLLDQTLVAGVGNIYASEALFRARISPRRRSRSLKRVEIERLRLGIRAVLEDAIRCGSTLRLNFNDGERRNGLFYFGSAPEVTEHNGERLAVYDRAGESCLECSRPIRRIVQAARSTFYCPKCQRV